MFDVYPVTTSHAAACGPASLKMLLDYYGGDVSLDDLIAECNVNLVGCTGKTLLHVGRAHCLDMKAFRMDADELIRQDRPAIVHWRHTHWCVCCGTNEKGNVVICNPSRGRYGIDPGSFAALYSGVAIFNGSPMDATQDYFGEHEPEPEYFDD